ncbi:MAG: 3'(2'),5'-bisphosphate nucleotidase [Planctomycetota bacterium]|jgi:3'(2'), 5'-bisphosphate nucleotidase
MEIEAHRPVTEAVAAACRVARIVQQDLQRVRQITKDDRSPVTVADYAVQAIVALALREHSGETLIVGEEHAGFLRQAEHAAVRDAVVEAVRILRPEVSGDAVLDAIDNCDHDGSADAYWTLDPVDGTKGFLRGQQYAIALARLEGGEVVLGAMGCPNLPTDWSQPFDTPDLEGAVYLAAAGEGSWQWSAADLDGEPGPIRARHTGGDDVPRTVTICESVEAAHSKHGDTQRVLDRLGYGVEYVRLDSQCKYAIVARGQADAYLRMPTRKDYVEKIWDHAAGMLIAQEAGAVVTDITGSPLDFTHGRRLETNRGVICAAAGVHAQIIETVGALGISSAV